MIITHLQPNTNADPRKCSRRSLGYILDHRIDDRLEEQNALSDVAYYIRNPRCLGDLRLTYIHQFLHVYLSRHPVFEFD